MDYKLLNSKYYKIYNQIIDNRISNPLSLELYGENHHIIPKSCGGSDCKENMVRLTAREHYLCHYLLTKFTESEQYYKMLHAFHAFNMKSPTVKGQEDRKINSHLYDSIRKQLHENNGFAHYGMLGKKHSNETIKQMRKSALNRKSKSNITVVIYDNNNNFRYMFTGGVSRKMKEHNLPVISFINSYKNDGKRLYDNPGKSNLKNLEKNGNIIYKGWYAIKLDN